MQETSELEFLRRLACPVVILACRRADGQQRAMVATLSYVAIEPAMVSFPVAAGSTTGDAIISLGSCVASILGFGSSLFDGTLSDPSAMLDENLRVPDAIAWAGLKVCGTLDVAESAGARLVVARVQEMSLSTDDDNEPDLPAIRYNRQYATLARHTHDKQSDDRYPI